MLNNLSTRKSTNSGFTLMELMIVVAIVGILLAVALPAFQRQVMKGHRAAAQSEMMEIANREHQYLLSNRAFTNDPNDFSYTLPTDVGSRYDLALTADNTGVPSFTITFTAKDAQSRDGGPLTLNSEGATGPSGLWD